MFGLRKMSTQSRPLDVITIGGSLAGLMASIALRRQGHHVRIFEQAPTPLLHDQGAGIVAGGETQRFLEQYDRTKTPNSVPSHTRLYLNKKGGIIHEESSLQHMTSWDLLYNIYRSNFDGIKTDYISQDRHDRAQQGAPGEGTYQHGRRVAKLEHAGDKVKVFYHSTIKDDDQNQIKVEEADLVVLAEGASSAIRKQLCPSAPPKKYAGYVAFRGTISETDLSSKAAEVFIEKFPFFHDKGIQILAYVIPGKNGSVEPGHRLLNWVWYWNIEDMESNEYKAVFTDKHGQSHRWTLPPGDNMSEEVWTRQKQRATDLLPPQFAEAVCKTKSPFVQAVADLEPSDSGVWKMDEKVVLVGDAVAGFRPHTAASTSQAAFHALRLGNVFAGEIGRDDYEREVMEYATHMQKHGVELGQRSQFGDHPLSGGYGQAP
ncbi:hypothetical protein DL546_000401 [Coniochaeta pulveracea]|uniref:2,6-dihydroxypyridine 3-monooxygenase substrate binding domain-containing protein n=1 Tax=Coniochaeta pulveracea TaxID=177199 RepID=A0A420XXL9_9PEZI|nr:hypothetical protein DL546_000401 [Coniochaeta pulveracea]